MAAAQATSASKRTALKRREFFAEITDALKDRLPAEMQSFNSRYTMNLLKIHYGENYRIHYEVWINTDTGFVELGLHFEDGPESTSRLLAHFDRHIVEIKHELGIHCELERWTKSWGHLYETRSIEPLTVPFAGEVAERIARMIVVLQPILDDAYELGLVSMTPRPSTFHRRWRNRK